MTDETWCCEHPISVCGENGSLARLPTSSLYNLSSLNSSLQLISQLFKVLWAVRGGLFHKSMIFITGPVTSCLCMKVPDHVLSFPSIALLWNLSLKGFYLLHEQSEKRTGAGSNSISGDLSVVLGFCRRVTDKLSVGWLWFPQEGGGQLWVSFKRLLLTAEMIPKCMIFMCLLKSLQLIRRW